MRKSAGFEVSDRISLAYEAGPRLTAMLERWGEFVASETLAVTVRQGAAEGTGHLEYLEVDGEEAKVELVRP
jgi:isoleucyl-tRNA synthetase